MLRTLIILLSAVTASAFAAEPLPLIPWPAEVRPATAGFELRRNTVIEISSAELHPAAVRLQAALKRPTGFDLPIIRRTSARAKLSRPWIRLIAEDSRLGEEGYRFKVSRGGVRIGAHAPAGFFYATQTLLQLMPPGIESKEPLRRSSWRITGATIADAPRFQWRGLMLDVSRHFFDKAFVEAYLDEMAKYKFNVFHWHLTDSLGWRLEIKSLPRLTEIGAWRAPRASIVNFNDRTYPSPDVDAASREGGYYTQDDIREIVAYAKERFITIVPEIDVPGHSYAMIAAYPEFSCSGKLAADPMTAETDALCPGKEEVFVALDTVIAEVAALFPGEYIHIGGDEVDTASWHNCPSCQAVMEREHLKDLDALQGYFLRRVEQIVRAHGKRLIGWDEVLDGGLSVQATVMSWQDEDRGLIAARQGHPVVMTPFNHCYLDFAQGDPALEPVGASWGKGEPLLLSAVYDFEPVPSGTDPKLVLGGQGNLWTELVANPRHVEYMTWPRGLALAEVLWTPLDRRPWPDFIHRMEAQFPRFDASGVKYARSAYEPRAELQRFDGESRVVLSVETPGIDLYYTFDGSNPDPFYPKYREPLPIPTGADQLRVVAFRHGQPVGVQLNVTIANLMRRLELREKYEAERRQNQTQPQPTGN
jgi:hexosaminidase